MLKVKCPTCLTEFQTDLELSLSALNENEVSRDNQNCPVCGENVKFSTESVDEEGQSSQL